MYIDWTTVITSTVTATIVGISTGTTQFLVLRYVARIIDKVEKKTKEK